MPTLRRRAFLASATAAAAANTSPIDAAIQQAAARNRVPCVVAMAANSRRILHEGAFGTRDAVSNLPVTRDSIFIIASMTKAITSVAALQMVDRKKITVDEPAERLLPELRGRMVFDGFDPATGRARLRPPERPVTLRHLLTHTSGLCYGLWDAEMIAWQKSPGVEQATPPPLMFEPGTRWQYGQGIDLAGRLVEAASGMSLEDYFQKNILGPLGMKDTSFLLPESKFERLVTGYQRQPDGAWKPNDRKPPNPPRAFNGGGGLYSTVPDYLRFAQTILRGAANLLSRRGFQLIANNQIGAIPAGILKTTTPAVSADLAAFPGTRNGHTLGFLTNPQAHAGRRAAGSLAWAGINNTFYWIDRARDRCGVVMMQFQPFVDPAAMQVLDAFEQAVYAKAAG